jgi:hypothetical protein
MGDINEFLKNEFYSSVTYGSLINSCDLAKGNCMDVSEDLYEYLLSLGYDDSQLQLIDLYNPKFDTGESHPEWRKFDKKHLVHSVLQVGDKYVDLTGSQFSKEQGGIKIYTKQDLSKLWGNYKIMKKDPKGNYIGGNQYKAKMRGL